MITSPYPAAAIVAPRIRDYFLRHLAAVPAGEGEGLAPIPDTAVIDAHIQRADFILITHTHIDHVLDMPYIAQKTGATVIGTESTYNFARSLGVAGNKLIVVRGGEDYELGGLSVRVIPSLHGVLRPFFLR